MSFTKHSPCQTAQLFKWLLENRARISASTTLTNTEIAAEAEKALGFGISGPQVSRLFSEADIERRPRTQEPRTSFLARLEFLERTLITLGQALLSPDDQVLRHNAHLALANLKTSYQKSTRGLWISGNPVMKGNDNA